MTTEALLTKAQIQEAMSENNLDGLGIQATLQFAGFARAIEQAVLQSPEVQGLREDSDKYQTLIMALSKIIADKVREALEDALEIIHQAKEHICAGGLAENAQYERSIVEPYLDGAADEINALLSASKG